MFPHLAEEMEAGSNRVGVNSVRSDPEIGEATASNKGFQGYSPDVIDFLRRCDVEGEGLEIINYLEKRCEINAQYAEKLRTQLRKEGIRSFGSKKRDDYYLREAGYG